MTTIALLTFLLLTASSTLAAFQDGGKHNITYSGNINGPTVTVCISAPSITPGLWVGFGIPAPIELGGDEPPGFDYADAVLLYPLPKSRIGLKHVTQVSTGAFGSPGTQGDVAVRLVNGTVSPFRACFTRNASVELAQDISAFGDPDSLSDVPAGAEIQRMNLSLVGVQSYLWAIGPMSLSGVPLKCVNRGVVKASLFTEEVGMEDPALLDIPRFVDVLPPVATDTHTVDRNGPLEHQTYTGGFVQESSVATTTVLTTVHLGAGTSTLSTAASYAVSTAGASASLGTTGTMAAASTSTTNLKAGRARRPSVSWVALLTVLFFM
ncbi:hypothetical protein BC830DRAFT_1158490 [Chytriomyces sp. MP71]|nr:hypothetical protein BC830DRAFT_1158490 [Chytriomyces sp. MP71]